MSGLQSLILVVAAEVAPAILALSGELPMGRAMGRLQEQFPSICLCCRKKSLQFMDGAIDREEHTLLRFNLFLRYFRVFLHAFFLPECSSAEKEGGKACSDF